MKNLLNKFLVATSAMLAPTLARMGGVSPGSQSVDGTNTVYGGISKYTQMSSAIDFQTFELDGEVKNLLWCGADNEIILLQTGDGSIYRSRDRGSSWKRLKALLQKQANFVADADQEIGKVHKVMQSPIDDQLVVFIGTNGINWISENCGADVKALNSGKRIQEFMFHPTQRNWALAASWTTCAEFQDEPCRIYKELYYTQDLGEEWNFITNYVFDFEWGQSELAVANGIKIPDSRIFVTRDATNTRHQRVTRKISWSTEIDLYSSDDFFATNPTMLIDNGNTIIKTSQYMFVSVTYEDQRRVQVYSSTFRSGFMDLKRARLPREALSTTTFTLMDTSEDQVFLYLENKGQKTPFGNLYISDEGARSFSLSMENIIKGGAVDFERVTSLDGTFIANRFSFADKKSAFMNARKMGRYVSELEKTEFTEEDLIAEEERKSSKSRMGNGPVNKKQEQTNADVFKLEESVAASEVEQNVRTLITHNKGGKWEPIRAPERLVTGKQTQCYLEDGCSLHLEIYSHKGELSPVYSTEKAVGLVFGTGNLGKRLTENSQPKHLYMSRDGGLNWNHMRPGVWIYEIGDHGAIVVIGKKGTPTNFVEFSWDEGQTWERLTISDRDLIIENIIIEPDSISQHFMVYGEYALPDDEDIVNDKAYDQQAFLVYLDFTQMHEPQCRGVDNAGSPDSDYELWTPHDGRFGDNQCFLGMHKTFVRRKQGALCFNGEDHETVTHVESCTCADMDYECDMNYVRDEAMGGMCVEVESNLSDTEKAAQELERQNQQCAEYGYYEVTQGYRKIPGNMCVGGIDLAPYRYQCSTTGRIFGMFNFRNIFLLAAIGALAYYGWPIIEAVLLLLPIPDPKDIKDKFAGLVGSASGMFKSSSDSKQNVGQYSTGFGAPGTLSGDSDDDDEEDIGREANQADQALNYDSDDKDEEDGASTELISLDDGKKKSKKVPKLAKPKN